MANKKLNAIITLGGAVAGSLKSAFSSTSSSLTKIGSEINRLKNNQRQLGNSIQTFGKMGKNVDNLRQRYSATTDEIKRLTKAQDQLNRVEKLRTSINNQKSTLIGDAGKTIALGATLMKPANVAMEFEATMSKVGAVARASDAELEKLTAQARELGAATVWSASQAAEGMTFLSMAGFKVNDVIGAMPGMLSLASAGGLELGRAADIASNILTGFSLKAEDMGRVSDVMTNAFTQSNVDVEMLGETMKYVAPVAAGLGVSLEQAAAMAGKLGDAGIQGSMAGTSLRSILGRLAAPPKAAADALAKLSVKTKDAAGNLRAVPDILAEIDQKTKNMGNAQRAGFFKAIAGEEAFSALETLAKQAGTGELHKFADAMKESGSANRVAAKMTDNAKGSITQFKSAMESVLITVGNHMLPVISNLAKGLASFVGRVDKFAQAHPNVVKGILTVVAGLLAFKVAVIAGKLALISIGSPILKLISMFIRFKGALGGLGIFKTVLAGAGQAVSGFAASGVVLKTVFSAGLTIIKQIGFALVRTPWGAVAATLVVAAVLIYKNWDRVKAFFVGFWAGLKSGLDPVISSFQDLYKSMSWLSPVISLIGQGISVVYDWFMKLLNPTKATEEQLKNATSAGQSFGQVVGAAINSVLAPINLLVKALTWIHERIGGIISKVSELAQVGQTINAVHGANGSIFSKAKDWGHAIGVFDKPSQKMQQAQANKSSFWGSSFRRDSGERFAPQKDIAPLDKAQSLKTSFLGSSLSRDNAERLSPPQQRTVPSVAIRGSQAPQQNFTNNSPVTIYAKEGQSPADIASEVTRQLNQNQRKQAAEQRSNMLDWGYAQ